MPCPTLEPNGYLQPGRHAVTVDEMRERFVDDFPASTSRPMLMTNWEIHRSTLRSIVPVNADWVGGSFVSSKPEPADVDTVALVPGPDFDALSTEQKVLVRYMTCGHGAQPFWSLDTFLIIDFPPNDPRRPATDAAVAYWHDKWGHTREDGAGVKHPRGYLEVQ